MTLDLVQVADAATASTYHLAVRRFGKSENPAVVCVHGLTRNGADFDYLAAELAEDFYVLCPDIPGRGKSPALENPALYNNGFYANLVCEWLKQEGLQSVHFVGTSMGGIIGMVLAATKPKLIRSFVVNDIGTFISKDVLQYLLSYVGVDTSNPDFEALANAVRKNLQGFGIQDPEVLEHFVRASIVPDPRGGWCLAYDPAIRKPMVDAPLEDIDLSELWAAVKCPLLILRGQFSQFLPETIAERMVTGRDNATLEIIADTGHAPHLSSPEQMRLVHQWLKQQAGLN